MLVVVLSVLVSATPNEERAKEHFAKGKVHYDAEEYATALAEYAQAYAALPLPAFLFNMAQCHRLMRDYDMAVELYQRYLDEEPNPPNRSLVDDLLLESRQKAEEAKAPPPPAVPPPPPPPPAQIVAVAPPAAEPVQVHETWWFWTIVGGTVVVAAAATVTAVALSADGEELPMTSLGIIDAR